jgi:2-polyprenyl-3-methyl-5-hydroxy-6-metoxy-1,4-benzoquinol methylase
MALSSDYTEKSDFYFSHIRYDVIEEIKKTHQKNPLKWKRVLEIGCGNGATGKELKNIFEIEQYVGIELMPNAAEQAKANIDVCYCGKVEDVLSQNLDLNSFDAILFLDVLEHLYDPWTTIEECQKYLAQGGVIISSIPNAGFYEVIIRLLFDRFEYNPNGGILDSTHIRFFTKHTINQLFSKFNIIHQTGKTVDFNGLLVKFIYFFIKPLFRKQFTIQYITIAQTK